MSGEKPIKVPKLDESAEKDGEQEDGDEHQQKLEKVVAIQNEIDMLNEQASEEILHVEQKYNKLRRPHFERRSELIKILPDFWMTTLLNNKLFADFLHGEDELVLQYLENVTVDEFDDVKSGYKITFFFRPNPYFDNTTLWKEFVMGTDGDTVIKGSEITWKPGKDLTKHDEPPQEITGRKRPLEEGPSFFCWFLEPPDEDGNEVVDAAAEIIKDDIWPNPLQFYLGPADTSLDETFDEEEEEEEEEEEDDDESPDEDEILAAYIEDEDEEDEDDL